MRIDPTKMSPEQIAQANKDWMDSQIKGGTKPIPELVGSPGFTVPNQDPLYLASEPFPVPPEMSPPTPQPFDRSLISDDRGFFGRQPSYGGMNPYLGGIMALSQLTPEQFDTGMQRFERISAMQPTGRQAMPGFNTATGQMSGSFDAGEPISQFPANQYYGMGRTGNPYGIGTGGSPYTQPYFQSSFMSPMNMGYGSNYRQGLYMPRNPYGGGYGGYGGKGGYSPQPSFMGGKGGYGR